MAQFMLILGGADKSKVVANRAISMKRYEEWTSQLIAKNHMRGGNKLVDGEGRSLKMSGDKIVDGPYSETKETVGGFYIIEASCLDEATEIAKGCPILDTQGGYVEVRRVER